MKQQKPNTQYLSLAQIAYYLLLFAGFYGGPRIALGYQIGLIIVTLQLMIYIQDHSQQNVNTKQTLLQITYVTLVIYLIIINFWR